MAEPGFLAVHGHEEIRARLARAVEDRRLPQSLLLHGIHGVGKQRLALWTAAALNCKGEPPRPCGACGSCRLASRLEHPDIHWFFPLSRPKGTASPEKLQQKLDESRAAVLEDRRANPHYLDESEGATGIYVAAVHIMRRLAHKTPAMGPAKVMVIGRAEALVPQAASPEAANALLKLLEEPPSDTTLILTSDVPGALLSTIRSRVQAVRVPPLGDAEVRGFLESELDMPPDDARHLAALSGGSIGRALELRGEEYDLIRRDAADLLRAALDGRLSARLAAAHRFNAFGARGTFVRLLNETSSQIRDLLASSLGAAATEPPSAGSHPEARQAEPSQLIRALEAVQQAQALAERNVNPQLIVVNFLRRAGSFDGNRTSRHAGQQRGR